MSVQPEGRGHYQRPIEEGRPSFISHFAITLRALLSPTDIILELTRKHLF